MEKLVFCLHLVSIVIFMCFQLSIADTGSPDENQGQKCTLMNEEIKILNKILDQETSIRVLREELDILTNETVKLSKIKDLILSVQGEMKIDITETINQADKLSHAINNSRSEMDILQKEFTKRFERLEKQVTNLQDFGKPSSSNDTQMIYDEKAFCPTTFVANTGLVQSGYAMTDCTDIHKRYPEGDSGPYRIYPAGGAGYIAYCDMVTDGGGWTVFQRRQDGSVDFFRGWNDYKTGFGNVTGEHWLGNKAIHELSRQCHNCELRINLEDFAGNRAYAKYYDFSVGSEAEGFVLGLGGYSGTAGDSFINRHKGMKFSTKDKDHDISSRNCAESYHGAWWFKDCFTSHLNGWYFNSQSTNRTWDGIIWDKWRSSLSLKSTKMMIRKATD